MQWRGAWVYPMADKAGRGFRVRHEANGRDDFFVSLGSGRGLRLTREATERLMVCLFVALLEHPPPPDVEVSE